MLNHDLELLQPYPFERLRQLFSGIEPPVHQSPIAMQIGEPKHPAPSFVEAAIQRGLSGLSTYPLTAGTSTLRVAIRDWISRRYGVPDMDPDLEILPVNGSREALFAIAQVVIDRSRSNPTVVCPNPFYQIYEGAAILAGGQPYFVNCLESNGFAPPFEGVPDTVWASTQLVYVCSPGNPSGHVLTLGEWRTLFELSAKFGFVIASDECYSELYFDESKPPLGALAAARACGTNGYERLIVFSSLSKRSNLPGMRSGFVAGDRSLIRKFLLYRTYHGSAMSPMFQFVSTAAWSDEDHVIENRRAYSRKFYAVLPILKNRYPARMPAAGFYLWIRLDEDDQTFAKEIYRRYNLSVLPGSFLSRTADNINPGQGFVRLALVASLAECVSAAQRLDHFRTIN